MSRITEVAEKLGVRPEEVPQPLSRGAAKEVGQLLTNGMPPDVVLRRLRHITEAAEQLGRPKPVQTNDVIGNMRRIAILEAVASMNKR